MIVNIKNTFENLHQSLCRHLMLKTFKNYNNDSEIKAIVEDYFIFQESFLNLLNNKISITYPFDNAIYFNEILFCNDLEYDKSKYEILFFTGYNERNNNGPKKNMINWSSMTPFYNDDLVSFVPSSPYRMTILSDNHDRKTINIVRMFLNNHLKHLNKSNQKKINNHVNFFKTFFSLSLLLKSKKIEIKDYVPQKEYLSKKDIINHLEKSKDFLLLVEDISIQPYLNQLNEQLKPSKFYERIFR